MIKNFLRNKRVKDFFKKKSHKSNDFNKLFSAFRYRDFFLVKKNRIGMNTVLFEKTQWVDSKEFF